MTKASCMLKLTAPIQVRTGDYRRKWVDARITSVKPEQFPEYYGDDEDEAPLRLGLSFNVEYEDDDGQTYCQHVADAFGWSADNWRYKEKCCEQCAWSSKEGGDVVPYGSTTATLPAGVTCECPDMPEVIEVPYDETNGGKSCDYFKEHNN